MGGRRRRHRRSPEEMDRARGRASYSAAAGALTPLQCGARLRVAAPKCGGQPRNLSQNHMTSKPLPPSPPSFYSPILAILFPAVALLGIPMMFSNLPLKQPPPPPPHLNEVALFLSCTRSRLFASKC